MSFCFTLASAASFFYCCCSIEGKNYSSLLPVQGLSHVCVGWQPVGSVWSLQASINQIVDSVAMEPKPG